MPGQFPIPEAGNMFTAASKLATIPAKSSEWVPANKMVFPTSANLRAKAGISMIRYAPNIRCLGTAFEAPTSNNRVNPANPTITDARVYNRTLGVLNMQLSGVSQDSTGTPLPNCRVMIFRTDDKSFITETISDGAGNWSVPMMAGGPFFLVEYRAGAPDVAGTSVNTLVPDIV